MKHPGAPILPREVTLGKRQQTTHRKKDRLGEYLVQVYNADKSGIDRLMYGNVKGLREQAEKAVFTRLPHGWRSVDLHIDHFRHIVDRWLERSLTTSDHDDIAVFVLNHRGPDTYEGQTYLRLNPGFMQRFLMREFKKNPLEPLTRAYWELHLLITAEGEGRRISMPRHCVQCNRLYLPIRTTLQTTCSPRCSQRGRYLRYLQVHGRPSAAKEPIGN